MSIIVLALKWGSLSHPTLSTRAQHMPWTWESPSMLVICGSGIGWRRLPLWWACGLSDRVTHRSLGSPVSLLQCFRFKMKPERSQEAAGAFQAFGKLGRTRTRLWVCLLCWLPGIRHAITVNWHTDDTYLSHLLCAKGKTSPLNLLQTLNGHRAECLLTPDTNKCW